MKNEIKNLHNTSYKYECIKLFLINIVALNFNVNIMVINNNFFLNLLEPLLIHITVRQKNNNN